MNMKWNAKCPALLTEAIQQKGLHAGVLWVANMLRIDRSEVLRRARELDLTRLGSVSPDVCYWGEDERRVLTKTSGHL